MVPRPALFLPCRWYAANAKSTWPDALLRPTLEDMKEHLRGLKVSKAEQAKYMRGYRAGKKAEGEGQQQQVGRRRGGRRRGACATSRTCGMLPEYGSAAVTALSGRDGRLLSSCL